MCLAATSDSRRPYLIVYCAEATALSSVSAPFAIARIVSEDETVIGPTYRVDYVVGKSPFVV